MPNFARLLALSLFLPLFWSLPSRAQIIGYSTMTADNVSYNAATGLLIASGQVVVIYNQTRMEAESISYNRTTGTIEAIGPLRITDPSGAVFTASMATLSADLSAGIIQEARLLLSNRFQIAAAEIRRSSDRFNILYRTVGSTCTVSASAPVPIWQIRSERIIHDTEAKRLYFEDARLEVLGVPVAFIPNLRLPDPSVQRATGLLYPQIISSEIYGYGLKIPYFLTFGDNADATFTPFATTSGAFLFEAEYRRRFHNGAINIHGGFAVRGSANDSGDSFLKSDVTFTLANNFEAFLDLSLTSDDAFMRRYGYDDADRLVSQIGLRRFEPNKFLEVSAIFFQSLRDDEVDAEVPFALPSISYRRTWEEALTGGRMGINASTLGLIRASGRDVARLSASVDWRKDWSAPLGIRATTFAKTQGDIYRVWDDMSFGDELLYRLTPSIGADFSLPLSKSAKSGALLVLSPIAQFIYTPELAFNDTVPNEDSLQVEFDETNLFGLSRFPGEDQIETGFRANVGLSYRRYDPSGWTVGVDVGQIFRANTNTQFSTGSGLSGKNSDILAAISFELPPKYRLISRLLVAPNIGIRRAETEIALDLDRLDLEATFVFLAADVVADSPVDRSEANIAIGYRISESWSTSASLRRDLLGNENIYGEIGLVYANECVEVAVSLSRRFTTSNNVPPDTNFDVSVKLAGFGGGTQLRERAGTCMKMQ
ncbi:MAG: LPS-assembly protein LptD [Rhodobacteraceae bacterium]|nr:LPS-assembly protein LptD [Paracoccaceae bacterium]